jgi:hypothetical protein
LVAAATQVQTLFIKYFPNMGRGGIVCHRHICHRLLNLRGILTMAKPFTYLHHFQPSCHLRYQLRLREVFDDDESDENSENDGQSFAYLAIFTIAKVEIF